MKLSNASRLGIALSSFAAVTAAAGPLNTGELGVRANRIAGLWSTQAAVRPCGTEVPLSQVRNTLLFHAGGTVVENPRFPPGGVANTGGVLGLYQRGQALGTWSYDPRTDRYWMHLQFDNFVDNVYHGFSTVDREIVLGHGGQQISGPVWVARFAADGSLLSELCGEAVSTRL